MSNNNSDNNNRRRHNGKIKEPDAAVLTWNSTSKVDVYSPEDLKH